MYLILDTSQQGETILAIGDRRIRVSKVYRARYHQAETLLAKVDALLKKHKTPLSKLEGIIAVLGPGPFTALRGSLIIANALSFALDLPVAGLRRDEFIDLEDLLQKGRARLKRRTTLVPFYGQEPNISQPKRK
ncbi:MAG: hypothetical protein HYV34_04445 [Candidatus Kerfeldbacteria bacterium]|nr:hypothetical protein [Candidatus Kerfeldbacteria bacterium]